MNRHEDQRPDSPPETVELGIALRALAPFLGDSTRLPTAGDLLRRARLRERELAAARLARWDSRVRQVSSGLLALAAAGVAYATAPRWSAWLLTPLVERPPMPGIGPGIGDAAVLAGAVLAASAAIVWVAQQFADE